MQSEDGPAGKQITMTQRTREGDVAGERKSVDKVIKSSTIVAGKVIAKGLFFKQ